MRGNVHADKLLFEPKIAKTERKKKKQATIKPPGESSSTDCRSIEKPPLVIDNRDGVIP